MLRDGCGHEMLGLVDGSGVGEIRENCLLVAARSMVRRFGIFRTCASVLYPHEIDVFMSFPHGPRVFDALGLPNWVGCAYLLFLLNRRHCFEAKLASYRHHRGKSVMVESFGAGFNRR